MGIKKNVRRGRRGSLFLGTPIVGCVRSCPTRDSYSSHEPCISLSQAITCCSGPDHASPAPELDWRQFDKLSRTIGLKHKALSGLISTSTTSATKIGAKQQQVRLLRTIVKPNEHERYDVRLRQCVEHHFLINDHNHVYMYVQSEGTEVWCGFGCVASYSPLGSVK